MTVVNTLLLSAFAVAISASPVAAQDFSRYRAFEFGMSVESVANLTSMKATDVRAIHQSTDLIQKLNWTVHGYFDKSPDADSAQSVRFDFYKGELYKIVVTYDVYQTNGLTTDDVIDSLSAVYGPATRPKATILVSGFQPYSDNQDVLARWENAEFSYNLFRSSYGQSFGLVAFSKTMDATATAADQEADRLDKLSAPERELERQKSLADAEGIAREKARAINKPKFRP